MGPIGLLSAPPTATSADDRLRAPVDRAAFDRALANAGGADARPTVEVRPTKTPLSESDAATALERAWTRRHGSPPSRETLAVLTAQWSHETGGGKSMYNYNFAGLKGRSPGGHTTMLRTREGYGANETHITDGFRAYGSAEEGADDYLGLLERRYGGALEAARRGDPEGFVHSLKDRGYFTGSEPAYVQSVKQLTARVLRDGPDRGDLGSVADALVPVGRGAGPAHSMAGFAAGPAPAGAHGRPAPGAPYADANAVLSALDAQILADELSRSALRIAVGGKDRT